MNVSAPFIERPVATTLLTLAIALAGALALSRLPIAPAPEADFPTIYVLAQMPGASPEVMATTVATPLERRLGAIADVVEINSSNIMGTTFIVLQFGYERDIDGAARDVQAAINAARPDLPASLRANPSYFKANLSHRPITYLSLTSATMTLDRVYEIATNVLQPKLASIPGVGDVSVLGSAPIAVRVELDPNALSKYGVGLETIRAALVAANANRPKGVIESGERRFQIYANDQARNAEEFRSLVVAYRGGLPIRLSDVAEVVDSVEDLRLAAMTDDKPAILVRVYRSPGANLLAAVDSVKERLTQLRASLPPAIDVALVSDRSATIRATVRDLEHTLITAGALVLCTVFVFLRNFRATLVPLVAVTASLIGTFGAMYLLKFSLNNLSLMALIVATGLVVDDSVIVLENVVRHMENGVPRLEAALRSAEEVSFTVLAISLSLIAIFVPFLFVGGVIGRFIGEFSLTLCAAILISLLISLTAAPMLCAVVLDPRAARRQGRSSRAFEDAFRAMSRCYDRTAALALRHSRWTLAAFLLVLGLNAYLYVVMPKGLLPQQDPGRLFGQLSMDPTISAATMRDRLAAAAKVILSDPAVKSISAVVEDDASRGSAELYIELKPKSQRIDSADEVNVRLSRSVGATAGATLRLHPPQDIAFSASTGSGGQFQYFLRGTDLDELRAWTRRLTEQLQSASQLFNPSSDRDSGFEARLIIDRDTASRLGISARQFGDVLYDAFGQRQVSTIYTPLNQHRVVMEVAPSHSRGPETFDKLHVGASRASDAQGAGPAPETMVPFSAITRFEFGATPLEIRHKDGFVASTISFNLASNTSLDQAMAAIERAKGEIHMPASIHSGFSGTVSAYQKMIVKEAFLILAAIATIYIVLGILYESFIQPIAILSTLPSAGLGAVLALMAFHVEFTVIAFIGVVLAAGIAEKNAIMIVDVALEGERNYGLAPAEAIHRACLLRFRPIMMTTVAAILSAIPLALGAGEGAELRQPLGVSIIGGLIVGQVLTLYTTPAICLFLHRFSRGGGHDAAADPVALTEAAG